MPTKEQMERRVLAVANMYVYEDLNMRELAVEFKTNKSNIHKDLRERIYKYDAELGDKVQEKIEQNTRERASKGGIAKGESYKTKVREPWRR